MLIGELSLRSGLSRDTIRFYEKAGLLDQNNKRGENNYRCYADDAIERLAFIRQGKALGFTLSEIKKVINEWDTISPRDKLRMTKSKIEEIDRKINQLQEYRSVLAHKVKQLEDMS